MSIPNEALRKLVQEIETQALNAQREISVVKSALSVKQRDVRLLELTGSEVKELPTETRVYEGVGRMFVLRSVDDVQTRLDKELKSIKGEMDGLGKKLHYLETTHKNSVEHVDKILNSGR